MLHYYLQRGRAFTLVVPYYSRWCEKREQLLVMLILFCRALLKAGASINHQDVDGWTPLHAAAHWGQEESCRLLIDAGADSTLKDKGGLCATEVVESPLRKLLKELIERKTAVSVSRINISHLHWLNGGEKLFKFVHF